ncbi:hypothetical protein YOLOSWAG_188 [Erwinia phage vB_EamM_Yoloswag]|uniref:Uncharacterized protein n=1 Tax=Erwinia phage vB_EamM_Yoloswag TaxID=1958956 RepID=A0A1S6L3A8_9CAUD|nr:endolysin [Erwinia phage vB_EamM_Yoloswag]AQT28667.1 hypothetical protein YOLOSWAG_188 [Erwinia phage vB_EamM_Yoloswag]
MTVFKDNSIKEVIDREGGSKYTNRAADRGGPTRWGVTEKTARAYGYKGQMQDLPYEIAYAIYSANYWDKCRCSELEKYSPSLAVWVFDYAVNSGAGAAAKVLQGLLNTSNNQQKLWKDIAEDGAIGPGTLNALGSLSQARGADGIKIFSYVYNGLRIGKLYNLAYADKTQEENFWGWVTRVINITKQVGA